MWPFSTTYPIKRLDEVRQTTYDYIIVGGGTAGSALASRLSEDPGVTVLLLERGAFQDGLQSRVPAASVANGSYVVNRKFLPDAQTGDRKVDVLTAETLEGNSRVNAVIYTRGAPAYYRQWGKTHPAWDWEVVEPYFSKAEETISSRQTQNLRSGIYPHLERSAEALGLPVETQGNRPDAPSSGYFSLDLTIDGSGYRHSAFRAYLPHELVYRRRDSLHRCTDVIVERLDLDDDQGEVRGVFAQSAVKNVAETGHLIRARREVILTAGAICDPQILQLSGIGPRDLLEGLGIPVARDLPGVGGHLGDHSLFPVFVEAALHDTLQQLLSSLLQAVKHALLFATAGDGWLKSTVDRAIYCKSTHIDGKTSKLRAEEITLDPQKLENIPDFEIMVVPIGTKPEEYPGKAMFTLQVCLNQPKSEGMVKVRSRDCRDS